MNNKKINEIGCLIFECILQCILIFFPILICISNLKWSTLYDADNLIAFAIFSIGPFYISTFASLIIIIPLVYFTHKIEEISGKLLVISIIIYTLITGTISMLLKHTQSLNFDKMLEYTLEIGIAMYSILFVVFMINTIRSFIKILKQ
jgi:hypothetical protein